MDLGCLAQHVEHVALIGRQPATFGLALGQDETLPAGEHEVREAGARHGTASLLTSQGIHPRTIMEILGHSTIAVTMNTYAHVAPALQREAASSLDVVFGSA